MSLGWRTDPHQLIREVETYIADGYSATKVRLGTEWTWDGVTVDRFLGLMRELFETAAGRIEIIVDGNHRLTFEQALPIARELERLGCVWFEEPMLLRSLDHYVTLSRAVEMPISGGEQLTTLEQFRPFLERGALSIVQPDAGLCGITQSMRIVERAADYGVDFCPHSWHNGLMAMAHAHLVAALCREQRRLELCMHQGPLQWGILADPPVIQSGCLALPDKPGLGVTLSENVSERFPMVEGHYALEVERNYKLAEK